MKIGIICAGDSEAAPFIEMVCDCVIWEKSMLRFYSGTIESLPVVTLFCGVCKTNAAIATQILIDTFGCDTIINAGTAGGMDRNIRLFDTVISSECAYWDVSQEILTEFHPWAESIFWKADQALLAGAKKAVADHGLKNICFGRMITGEAFIQDCCRDEINENFSPLCVDMETASIAHTCYVNHVPYLAVRTITDTVEHAGVDAFDQNCEKASQISADVVRTILKEIGNNPAR